MQASGGRTLIDENDLVKLKTILWRHNIVGFAPHLTALAEVNNHASRVALNGTWFDKPLNLPRGAAMRTGFAATGSGPDGSIFRTGVKVIASWCQVQATWVQDDDPDSLGKMGLLMMLLTLTALGGSALAMVLTAQSPTGPTIRRRPAGMHGPRAHQSAQDHSGRRADRQSGCRQRGNCAGYFPAVTSSEPHADRGHARRPRRLVCSNTGASCTLYSTGTVAPKP